MMGGQSRKVTGGNIGLLWVKMRNSHPEQMFSALPPKADSSRPSRHVLAPCPVRANSGSRLTTDSGRRPCRQSLDCQGNTDINAKSLTGFPGDNAAA